MDPTTIALISMYIGGASALTGVIGLGFQLRKLNTFKVLRDGLQEIKSPDDSDFTHKQEDELMVKWLSHASLILPSFRQRLFARFLSTLVVIVGVSWGISLDTPGQVIPQIQAIEWQDLLLIPISVFLGLINNTSLLMKAEEKEFLTSLTSLQNIFYEEYVIPAMVEFNVGTKKIASFPRFRNALAREKLEKKRIERAVAKYLKQ